MASTNQELNDFISKQLLHEWSSHHVSEWLKSIGMERYFPTFIEQNISGVQLCNFTEDDLLTRCKVEERPHRKKMWKRLKYVQGRWKSETGRRQRRKKMEEIDQTADEEKMKPANDVDKYDRGEDYQKLPIRLSLYTNGYPYEFHRGCTFCLEVSAIATYHCPSCKEFLCDQCDINTHKHIKRQSHMRTPISKYDSNSACQVITNFYRRILCRNKLREKAKKIFERLYDTKARRHYYRHRRTQIVQWNKPLSLGSEEIKPFLTQKEASFNIFNVYRCWRARCLVVKMIQEQYHKLYSLETGRFIYKYIGHPKDNGIGRTLSKLVLNVTLNQKPINLYNIDLEPKFTKELAIMRIQRFTRMCLAHKISRNIVRTCWRLIFDPISGRNFYHNPRTGTKSWCTPSLLGKERWDPNDVSLWTVDDTELFFRRLGQKKMGISLDIQKYAINGLLLLALEKEDFELMGISKDFTAKILHELETSTRIKHNSNVLKQKYRLRNDCRMFIAVKTIQRSTRRYLKNSKVDWLYNATTRQHYNKTKLEIKWWSEYELQAIQLPRSVTIGRRRTLMLQRMEGSTET